jgi:nuclear-control-of-ATPase protein 2
MVRDLGKDYYKLNGPELDALTERVKSGDMEQVLRVYEQEMQVRPRIRTMSDL